MAQSLYQYKTVHFTADIEHLDYRRLSVLSVSHDLTQWGFGGRVMAARRIGAQVQLTLDEPVPPLATPYIGLRVPGARDYRVWPVQPLAAESDTVTLVGEWPEELAFPGEDLDNPAHDTLWCYDFKATPSYRVRVTGIDPESDLKGARVTAVPEGPEFWDYVLNGTYVPAPNQSSIPQLGRPTVKNLRVTEKVNLQGDTEWYELSCVWHVEGDYDHAQVWAGRDGSELRLVDGSAVGSRSVFRIDGAGEWLIEVKPFNPGGQAGQSAVLIYITTQTQLPPRNPGSFVVQSMPGGLRRFAWAYTGDKPAALAGVQIRYLPGEVALSLNDWDAMQPLGDVDDIYTAQFETSRPGAGLWTFGLRAIDTAGQLANGIARFAIELGQSFDQIQNPDLTPPPVVTGLTAAGMLTSVQVAWDTPIYTVGHGHARTELWAGQGADLQQATQVGEGYAGPISFSGQPGQSWNIWARNVSADGVAGDWAGPVAAVTGEDVAGLLEVLAGKVGPEQFDPIVVEKIDQIDLIDFDRIGALNDFSLEQLESVAQVNLKRLDLIDIEGGPLGKSLVTAAAQQDALNQQVRGNMQDMAKGLLEAALAADAALERITDAGMYVDPATGQVKIYGLETTKDNVTSLEVLLDALSGQLQLKATTAYVDGKIAEAVLSPADLLLYEGLDARLINVVQQLDGINGTLSSKAEALELQNAVARLSTAESTLDALGAQISLRVTRAEYEAAQDALQTRLGSAELTLSALDVPAITATVTAVSKLQRESDKTAQALLQDILNGEYNRVQAQDALAFARNQLSASIQEGLAAEAAARTQLAATVGQQAAALELESLTRATADAAEASQRQALAATVQGNQQQTAAAIELEQTARVDGFAAEAAQREALRAQMQGEDDTLAALLEDEATTRATADGAEATARQQLAAQLQQAQSLLQAQISDETTARVEGDRAETSSRESQISVSRALSEKESERTAQALLQDILTGERNKEEAKATIALAKTELATQIREGLSAEALQRMQLSAVVEGQKAALEEESRVRVEKDAAEAATRTALAAQVQRGQEQTQATIQDERQARADADAAEAQQRQQLAATVGENHAAVQQQFTAQAGINGYLAAKYSLAVQVGSGDQVVVGGMQITGTAEGEAGAKIAIAFATDAFSIVATDGSFKSTPFYVQPADMTVNGVFVPAGAYMDSARIGNVEAIFGRFGTLFADKVQATAISASQLTAGNGVIGGTLKSSNYVAGSSGWTMRPDGMAEFSGVIVRGTLYSTAGNIGGITINANGLNTGAFVGYGWPSGNGTGFHLGPYGLLLGNPSVGRYLQLTADGGIYAPGLSIDGNGARFSGRLEAATGSFSGDLSGASGTFSGTLTAQRVVVTGNLDLNAATIPLYAQSAASYTFGTSALDLWTPAFDGTMTCVVDFGCTWDSASPLPGSIHLYVDGGPAISLTPNKGTPDPASPEAGTFNFSYAFSGNGNGRQLQLVPSVGIRARNRYIKATIFKR
ncbi:phage tail tip fiber protein [Comamonas sp.]|uniref:phage tail tip fiber protein n=1 Tax=Comamonas sp. TaxID=34028 RepID=UPI003A958024